MLKFEAFSWDGTFVDAGKRLKQLATPFIHVLKGDIALERMNHCFYEIDAFLRIRKGSSKYLAFADFTSPFSFCPCWDLADVFLDGLQLLRGNSQPALVDWAAYVMNQTWVTAWSRYFEVDEVLGLLCMLRFKDYRENCIVFELIFNAATRYNQVHVGVVSVPWKSNLDALENKMQNFPSDFIIESNKAHSHTRQFYNKLISILDFFWFHLSR